MMTNFEKTVATVLIACTGSTLLSFSAFANNDTTSVDEYVERDVQHAPEAWRYVHNLSQEFLTPKQRTKMSNLAYHGTVSVLCEGIVIDRNRFDSALTEFEHKEMDDFGDEEHDLHNQKILISYGTTLGVMLSEHAHDAADFCSEAQIYMDENPNDHLFDIEIAIDE